MYLLVGDDPCFQLKLFTYVNLVQLNLVPKCTSVELLHSLKKKKNKTVELSFKTCSRDYELSIFVVDSVLS